MLIIAISTIEDRREATAISDVDLLIPEVVSFAHVIAAAPPKTGLGTPSSSGLTLFLSSFEGLVSKFSIVDLAPGVWKLLLVVVSQLDVATYTGRPPKKGRGRVVC